MNTVIFKIPVLEKIYFDPLLQGGGYENFFICIVPMNIAVGHTHINDFLIIH